VKRKWRIWSKRLHFEASKKPTASTSNQSVAYRLLGNTWPYTLKKLPLRHCER